MRPKEVTDFLRCGGMNCDNSCERYPNQIGDCMTARVHDYVIDLEQRVPRWISVHDALPGMDEKVLFIPACNPRSVYIGKLKYVGEVNAVYFVVNNWRRTVTYSATHWMPLPELPEE